eukprot:6453890-Amphidinium_carterae.1
MSIRWITTASQGVRACGARHPDGVEEYTLLKHLTAQSGVMDTTLTGDVGEIPDMGEVRADILEVLLYPHTP